MDSPKKQASKILRDKKMYQRWLAIFMCLALVVTSGTVTALKLTGQAWTGTEQVLTCTYQPHQHTPECYNEAGELVCGLSDKVLHTHDARCYDAEGNLVCGMEELEEHSHTSACYTEHRNLICGQEEHEAIPEHHHTEDCYTVVTTEERVLTCGLEESDGEPAVEAVPGHVHTDACYAIETKSVLVSEESVAEDGTVIPAVYENQETKTLICGMAEGEGAVEGKPAVEGHHHTDACWTMQEVQHPELTCGLEESDVDVPEHHHTDECYATEMVLTCDKPEVIAHEHTDACYDIQKDADGNEISRTLTCKLPQLVAHQHGDECFTEVALEAEGTYCGKEAHKHSGSCYMDVNGELVLTCGKEEHVHTDECFIEPVLYCGKEEHTHTEECYDADGNLICELEEHTHTAECHIEPEIEPVEVTETVANRFYNVELTAVYTGELAEEDELAIVAATTSQEEMETERDYAYSSQVPDSKVLPLGRTEFILTKNGEEVDRSEYAITATIIPSRESVAYLAMSQGDTDIMMLDEGGEPGGEQTIVVSSGFTAYELEDGKLAPVGYVEARLDEIDLDSYMAEAYDEEGNPTYDETLAIHAHLSGSDFMLTAGVEEDIIEGLAIDSESNQGNWEGGRVWWDGYKQAGTTYQHEANAHVQSVTMTHMDGAAGKPDQTPVTIFEGAGENVGSKTTMLNPPNAGADLSTIYPNATGRDGKVICPMDQATHVRVRFTDNEVRYYQKGTTQADKILNNYKPGDYYNGGYIAAITGAKDVSSSYGKEHAEYAQLEITTEPGYYVESVVIACFNCRSSGGWNPYKCTILTGNSEDGVFRQGFEPSAKGSVTTTVGSQWFGHGGSSTPNYYILIRTAPIPSPLFVTYDAGDLSTTFTNDSVVWLTGVDENGGRLTQYAAQYGGQGMHHDGNVDEIYKVGSTWTANELSYTAAGITPEAAAAAKAQGLRFAGWKVEFFDEAQLPYEVGSGGVHYEYVEDVNGNYYYNLLSGNYEICRKHFDYINWEYVNHSPNDGRKHYRRVEVTGGTTTEWRKVNQPVANNFANVRLVGDNGNVVDNVAAYGIVKLLSNAKLVAQWEPLPTLTVTKQVVGLDNGEQDEQVREYQFQLKKMNGTESTWEQVGNPFTISVKGQSSASYDFDKLPNGTYSLQELKNSTDEAKTTYAVNDNEPTAVDATFVVDDTQPVKNRHVEVLVVNDYEKPKGQMVMILKVDASNNTADSWPTLAGAKFTLKSTDPSIVIPEGALKAETGADGIAFSGRLPVGTYTLTEDTAPTGYEGAGSIGFEVQPDGRVTVTNDGTNGNYVLTVSGATAVHEVPDDLTSPIIRYEIRVKNTVAPAQVKVIKVSNQNKETTLPDAHFDLYKEVTEVTAGAELIYDKDSHKIYGIKVNENDIITNNLGEAMLVDKTLTDGSGLQFDQRYYLIETQAPAGYNGSDQPIELYYYKVTGTQTFELEVKSIAGSSLEAERVLPTDKENPVWGVKVPNSTGTEMPHTGGMGTGLFTVGGGLLMVLAAGLYFWNKRRISEM